MTVDKLIQTDALFKLGYGVYIVSAADEGTLNGQIATVVFQVTSDPVRVATCINKANLTHEIITRSGRFGVSVLEQDTPIKFIGRFGFKSGRDLNKFEGVKHEVTANGVPLVLENTVSVLSFKVMNHMDTDSHTMFVGVLETAKVLNDKTPMTYDYYHRVKNMKSPKTAPTFVQEI